MAYYHLEDTFITDKWNLFISGKVLESRTKSHECQDRILVAESDESDSLLAVVLDGHGNSNIADFLVHNLPEAIFGRTDHCSDKSEVLIAIQDALLGLDKFICQSPFLNKHGGCVVVMALINHPLFPNEVLIINIGDCWACQLDDFKVPYIITKDHNAAEIEEQNRIMTLIKQVFPTVKRSEVFVPKSKDSVYLYSVLQPTRSFGDCFFKVRNRVLETKITKRVDIYELISSGISLIDPIADFFFVPIKANSTMILSSDGYEKEIAFKKYKWDTSVVNQNFAQRNDDASILSIIFTSS
ncbi:hypothetical protein RCL1_000874 [Eukaryota sp. TZLM3-RCL]